MEIPNEIKKSPRNRWLFGIAILTLVVTLLVVAGVVLLRSMNSHTKPVPTRFASPRAIIDKLQPQLEGNRLFISSADGMGGVTRQGYTAYTLPPYQVNKNYQTTPSQGDGSGVLSSSETSKANYAVLSQFFTQHHFEKLASERGKTLPLFLSQQYDFTLKAYDMYDSETIRCVISRMDVSALQQDSATTSVGCADKSQYKDVAREVAPLYEAYVKSEGNDAGNVVFGLPIETQGSDGYTNITIYQEIEPQDSPQGLVARKGLYYKVPGDDALTFFTHVGGVPDCLAFDAVIVKEAFKGYECYDQLKNSYSKV